MLIAPDAEPTLSHLASTRRPRPTRRHYGPAMFNHRWAAHAPTWAIGPSLPGAKGALLCTSRAVGQSAESDDHVLHCIDSEAGDVELAPWLTEGDNRLIVMHISTNCQRASLQCAAVRVC